MSDTFKIRRQFLVNPRYQFRFVRLAMAGTLVVSLLLIGAFYFFQKSQLRDLSNLTLSQEQVDAMQRSQTRMFMKYMAVILLVSILQCILAILASHRTAGPLYRLKRTLSEISQGSDLERIAFRQNDHFLDVQDAYNEMVGVLEKERQNDLKIIEQIEDGIDNLKRMTRDEHIFQIAEYIERLNNDLKNFKTR